MFKNEILNLYNYFFYQINFYVLKFIEIKKVYFFISVYKKFLIEY